MKQASWSSIHQLTQFLQIAAHEAVSFPLDELCSSVRYNSVLSLPGIAFFLDSHCSIAMLGTTSHFPIATNKSTPFTIAPTVFGQIKRNWYRYLLSWWVVISSMVLVSTGPTTNQTATKQRSKRWNQKTKHIFRYQLVTGDTLWTYRRDPHGYRGCLQEFDERLPEIIAAMNLLMITADRGPTRWYRPYAWASHCTAYSHPFKEW